MVLTEATTSLQRTYRYLRIALVGTVVVLFVSVAVAVPLVGSLPSISHYFYTPARNGFVGALIAASLALFALSGRRAEPVILDAAALLAPLIAIVPTVIDARSVPGFDDGCRAPCVPSTYVPDVNNGIVTYLIVGVLIVVVAIALFRRIVPGVWIAIGVLTVVGVSWEFFFDAFLLWAHAVAATAFFALIAAFAVRSAFPGEGEEFAPSRRLRVAYVLIAALLVVDLIGLIVLVATGSAGPGILIGESLALALFAAYWMLQTVQKWGQANPSIE